MRVGRDTEGGQERKINSLKCFLLQSKVTNYRSECGAWTFFILQHIHLFSFSCKWHKNKNECKSDLCLQGDHFTPSILGRYSLLPLWWEVGSTKDRAQQELKINFINMFNGLSRCCAFAVQIMRNFSYNDGWMRLWSYCLHIHCTLNASQSDHFNIQYFNDQFSHLCCYMSYFWTEPGYWSSEVLCNLSVSCFH